MVISFLLFALLADQDDPDEWHDPDSDMEVDDHKAMDESARSLSPSLPL